MPGWLLVALCAATGSYCLLRMRSGSAQARGAAGGEAVMGFGMAAMAVPAAFLSPPPWLPAGYAVIFGGAALRALWLARGGVHHLHHVVGSLAMVYMALAMAPGAGGGAHAGHEGHAAGGVPLLTGALLLYFAGYVLSAGARLLPTASGGGSVAAVSWGARPELALACRLSMGVAMLAMLGMV
ncbi:membrane protein [Streptomyces sp. WM6378]|nr:membrane protein [Streptomyces sp. WM6378]